MTTVTAPDAGSARATRTEPGQAPPQDRDRGSKPFSGRRPRWVTPLIVIGLLLAFTMAMTLLKPADKGNTDDLDPANPGFTGSQGLARVLRDHGVSVTVVRTQGELLDRSVDGATTVVITSH